MVESILGLRGVLIWAMTDGLEAKGDHRYGKEGYALGVSILLEKSIDLTTILSPSYINQSKAGPIDLSKMKRRVRPTLPVMALNRSC